VQVRRSRKTTGTYRKLEATGVASSLLVQIAE